MMSNKCPCNSQRAVSDCCGRYLSGQFFPETPEALMRSRYTAYSLSNIAYIQQTMRGAAAKNFNPDAARQWASEVQWLGLKIIAAPPVVEGADIGFVKFVASYRQLNHNHIIHELSEFQRLDGRWYYIKGTTPKVNRNQPCPCRSGKKFKRCCGSES